MIDQLVERAVSNALRDVGTREVGGNNRGTLVERYQERVGGHPGESWCYAAVYTWFDDAARSLVPFKNPLPKTRSCHFAFDKLITTAGIRLLKAPTRGCLAFRDRGKGQGHVGIVIDTRIPEGRIITVEGNTNDEGSAEGDAVAEKSRDLGWWNMGYIDVRPTEWMPR